MPAIRVTTKVIKGRPPSLFHGLPCQGYACLFQWDRWIAGAKPHQMLGPTRIQEGGEARHEFLPNTRVIGDEGSAGKYYMLVNVPVGGDPHSKNERTLVVCKMCFDSKQVRDLGNDQKIWCGASMDEVVRKVDTLVSFQQMKRLLQGQGIGTAQTLVNSIGRNELLKLGTAKTVVYTIGPFTLVVTHVEGHLPCKEAPVADDASTMPAGDKPHIQHSAFIWIYFEDQLRRSSDACDLSNSTVEETITVDGEQFIQYTLSVHSVQDTQALSRCPVEVDQHVLSAVKTIRQEWSNDRSLLGASSMMP